MRRWADLCIRVVLVAASGTSPAWGLTPKKTSVGETYRVINSSRFKGWSASIPINKEEPTRAEFLGSSKVAFREQPLSSTAAAGRTRLFRVYDVVEYSREFEGKEEKARLRQQVRRVLLDPLEKGYVVYSPDGPLRLAELSMLSDHTHVPLLETFLPDRDLKPGDTWPADKVALCELTGLDTIESGSVECKFEGEVQIQQTPFAQISATGSFLGSTGGQRSKCSLRAGIYLDPTNGRFVSLRAVGKQESLGPEDKVLGEVQVDFQALVEPLTNDAELAPEVVAKLPKEPSVPLLQLEFESPEKGIRVVHSRQWILQRRDADRFFFAGPNVSFVVTAEPVGKVPQPQAYFDQVSKYMAEQKIETKVSQTLSSKEVPTGSISHFQLEGKVKDRPSLLDYWVISSGERGVTVASNAPSPPPEGALAELENIVASIQFFEPITSEPSGEAPGTPPPPAPNPPDQPKETAPSP